jgi:hypothetical protein
VGRHLIGQDASVLGGWRVVSKVVTMRIRLVATERFSIGLYGPSVKGVRGLCLTGRRDSRCHSRRMSQLARGGPALQFVRDLEVGYGGLESTDAWYNTL